MKLKERLDYFFDILSEQGKSRIVHALTLAAILSASFVFNIFVDLQKDNHDNKLKIVELEKNQSFMENDIKILNNKTSRFIEKDDWLAYINRKDTEFHEQSLFNRQTAEKIGRLESLTGGEKNGTFSATNSLLGAVSLFIDKLGGLCALHSSRWATWRPACCDTSGLQGSEDKDK